MACSEALRNGKPFLLDPIMKVEVFVPEAFMGEVIGDLNARDGKIEAIEHRRASRSSNRSSPWHTCSAIPPRCAPPPKGGNVLDALFPLRSSLIGRIGTRNNAAKLRLILVCPQSAPYIACQGYVLVNLTR